MKPLGLYIHIPFCKAKCIYCDFYSLPRAEEQMDAYVAALRRDIAQKAGAAGSYTVDTVYFGGGTPSYLGAERLEAILETVFAHYHVSADAEITTEANPDSACEERSLRHLREAGFNRISLGMQSACDEELRRIGRVHTHEETISAVKAARAAGFDNVSLDLIYGLPGQTSTRWEENLRAAIALAPEHLSCYGLKVEEGTPLYEKRSAMHLPDDDTQAEEYLAAVERLARAGYRQYEISNFARPGYESRHNLKYWRLDDYIGFGAAAASNIGLLRYTYTHNVREYISGVLGDKGIIAEEEELTPFDRASEYLMLGMRTAAGISREEYRSVYQSSFDKLEEMLEVFQENGWAVCDNGRWHFTPGGFLVSNVLIGVLLESQTKEKFNANPWIREAFEAKGQKVPLPTASEPYMN